MSCKQRNLNSGRPQNLLKQMFKWVLLVAVILICYQPTAHSRGDGCHMRELELCYIGATSMFQNPRGIPMSDVELKRQCEIFNESVDCAQDYTERCLSENQSLILSMATDQLYQMEQEFCNKESELRSNYTKHVGCIRGVQKKFQRGCLSDFQVGFESIHKQKQHNRVSIGCCNLNRLRDCLHKPIKQECGMEADEMVSHLLSRIFGRVMWITCRSYVPSSAQCGSILPTLGSKPFNGRNTSAISRIISSLSNGQAA